MRTILIVFSMLIFAGCASTPVYNPMQVANNQELLLNENGFKSVQEGMSLDQVHQIMGQELTIGYQAQSANYTPVTIPNPYRTENLKGSNYIIEYYLQSIIQPDGVIHDNQLMPLIFKDGKLVGRGWPLANSLHPEKSSA